MRKIMLLAALTLASVWAYAQAPTASTPASAGVQGMYSVADFGAVGDGVANDWPAFQQALERASSEGGGVVMAPRGKYRIEGHLTIPERVTLQGIWTAPSNGSPFDSGSVLYAIEGKDDEAAPPFITLYTNATLKGINIFYPEQENTMTPHAYPWCIAGKGDNVSIIDCTLVNPYKGIDLGTYGAGRHYVKGVYGQPLRTGLYVNICFDVGRLEDIHFWPFWSGPDLNQPAAQYMRQNGTAFVLEKTDGEMLVNCFCIYYNVGLLLQPGNVTVKRDEAPRHEPGSAMLTNCYFDDSEVAVRIKGVQANSGVSFVNCQFMSTVEVAAENRGEVKFTGCGFWSHGTVTSHAKLEGQGAVLLESCQFSNWDRKQLGAACIDANCRRLIVNGCEFTTDRTDHLKVALGPATRAAVITSNIMAGGILIDNKAPQSAAIQIANNVSDMEQGFLDKWVVLGAFPNPAVTDAAPNTPNRAGYSADYLAAFGGEAAAVLKPDTIATYTTADGEVKTVAAAVAQSNNQHTVDLKQLFPDGKQVAYGFCYLNASKDTRARLLIISNDCSKAWVNGAEVFAYWNEKGGPSDPVEVSVDLKEGLNPILLKVEDAGGRAWSFKVEAYDAEGNPVETVLPE